ncbi:MAG: 7-carboxy-7-deazaguanine synthase [Pseudomonadota bacterium]|nr:7-carboxy-7-deazaguanine synthase [Pseudomonadota bacterium]
MVYSVKELYYTLQGEGIQTGRPAVFCRFSGCNLWSGRERERPTAICQFCDTEFVGVDGPGGGKFNNALELARAIAETWASSSEGGVPYVVCTGGEPLLQLDTPLIEALKQEQFQIGIETNGTISAPEGLDWVCVSPKANSALVQTSGNELKLVYPQHGVDPAIYIHLAFEHFLLQPKDGPNRDINTSRAAKYCEEHKEWRVSVQTHKLVGLM